MCWALGLACFVINRGACVYRLRLAVDLGESFRREGGRGLEKRVRRRQVTKVNINCVSGVDSVPVTWIDERVTSPLWSSSPNPRAQSNPVKSVRGSPTRGRPAAPRIAVKVIGSQEGLSRPAGASGDATERPVVSWTASGSGRGAGERPRQQEGRVGLGGGRVRGSRRLAAVPSSARRHGRGSWRREARGRRDEAAPPPEAVNGVSAE